MACQTHYGHAWCWQDLMVNTQKNSIQHTSDSNFGILGTAVEKKKSKKK